MYKEISNYKFLIKKLDEFIRKYYYNELIKGVIYSIALIISIFLSIIFLEYFGKFNTIIRTALFYSSILLFSFIIFKFIIIPLLKLSKISETISNEQAALIIGKHFSEINDKLINVLQLHNKYSTEEKGISKELIEASINQKIEQIKPIPILNAINLKENKKYLKFVIFPVFILIILLLLSPQIIVESSKHIIMHNEEFVPKAPFNLIISNKELKVFENEDLLLKVKIQGDVMPSNLFLNKNGINFQMKKLAIDEYTYNFKKIHKNLKFKLIADDYTFGPYNIIVLPKANILKFQTISVYPTYLHKKTDTLKNIGNLIVPEGTKITWIFTCNNTENVKFFINDTSLLIKKYSANLFKYQTTLFNSTNYSFKAENKFFKKGKKINYRIEIIKDKYPEINVKSNIDSISLKQIYFLGLIKDDYGFTKLMFNYREKTDTSDFTHISIPILKEQTNQNFYYLWDLSNLNIKAGKSYEYFFSVWDNDGVNGPKESRTPLSVYKLPDKKELEQKSENTAKNLKKALEESIFEANVLHNDLEKLNKDLIDKNKLSWEDKKKIEKMIERQKNLKEKLKKLNNESNNIFNQLSEFNQLNEELLKKQKQIQELMDELLNDEMKEILKEMEKMLGNINKEELKKALDQLKLDNKSIEKELNRTLELFKQLELEKKIEETKNQLKELANKQEKLSEKTGNKDIEKEAAQDKQNEINEEFKGIEDALKDIQKKNEELEYKQSLPNTDEDVQDINNSLQESKENLSKNKMSKASKSQKNASNKMNDLAMKLQNALNSMRQSNTTENIESLRNILDNLLTFSIKQEDLMKELKNLSSSDPKYVLKARKQQQLLENAKIIEDSLFALSKRVASIKPIINKEISSINQNAEKVLKNLKDRRTSLANMRQQYIMTAANNLALLLSDVLQQLQEQLQNQMAGQGTCNKPGGKSPKPSISSLKQLQQQLNEQMKQLKDAMQKGQKPGGEQEGEQWSKEFAKIAAKQAALRYQLQKLMEKENTGDDYSNMLKEINKKMEETEKDLIYKKISRETLIRQKEILTRLLKAEKAEREREYENKREAETAKNQEKRNLNQFLEYKRIREQEIELLKTLPPTLTEYYKNKVTDYFNKLKNIQK